tara:strand:+ start:1263 stop:2699 length:1437 start_codon:yes stop_codon:yes gene_type:complete
MPIIREEILKPLIVQTGKFTGRSPKDRYFVKTNQNKDEIDWGARNQSVSEKTFDKVFQKIQEHLIQEINYYFEGNVISDSANSYRVNLLTEERWYTQFAKNIFRNDSFSNVDETIKIYHAPSFNLKKEYDGLNHSNFIILHSDKKIILIGGTGYAGEIKKSVFSLLNIILLNQDILPMHCSANYDQQNGTTLYFGLSGTGKTTLSSDSTKELIGDDEHGWSTKGIFNVEGGCYAKVVGLDKNKEPEIFKSTMHPTTIIENVVLDDKNNINFNDTSITENTRSCYSLDIIDNIYQEPLAPHPKNIIMLSCDAFGVLPPVSKLTIDQAVLQFISGYTAKIPGTESDILEPIATFSPCFGGPFMPRFIRDYADLFRERLEKFNSQCWFINTGWWGGPYGVGKRIDLSITRAILKNCIKNSFDSNNFIQSEYFDLYSPTFLEEEKTTSLNPIDKWENKAAYEEAANNLNNLFKENYSKFSNL